MTRQTSDRTHARHAGAATQASSAARSRFGLAAATMLTLTSVSAPSDADARGTIPVLIQITHNTTGDVFDPKIRSQDGNRIVFSSTGDVLGPGTETVQPEIYLYEVANGQIAKITDTPGHGAYDAARPTDQVFAGDRPEFVAFISTADLDSNGEPSNADGNPEVFVWEYRTGEYHQLTDTQPPVVNSEVYPSDNGKCITFASTGDLNDNDGADYNNPGHPEWNNADGSKEVFLYTVDNFEPTEGDPEKRGFPFDGHFTQVSNGPAGTSSGKPTIGGYWFARQCQSTAYVSDHDQTDSGLVGRHVFIYDRNSANTDPMVAPEIPLGIPDGIFDNPSISSASPFARGPFVVFDTSSDLWVNGSSGFEMFRYRVFHPRMTQYTDIIDPFAGDVRRPVISDGGGVIAMESTGDLINPNKKVKPHGLVPPFNADGNSEIFRQKGRRRIAQLTRTGEDPSEAGCANTNPSIRDQGIAIAFRSDCKSLVPGFNDAGVPQIFLYVQVKSGDPLACVKATKPCECHIEDGCCNEANGCYQRIEGATMRPRKKLSAAP
jgi:hypothetical protein